MLKILNGDADAISWIAARFTWSTTGGALAITKKICFLQANRTRFSVKTISKWTSVLAGHGKI